MRTVGIRDLKNRLSEYVRLVRQGEEILVTDRGVVVAELRPPGSRAADVPHPALAEAARQGRIRIGPANYPDLYPKREPLMPEGSAEELLDWVRGER
jgi:antitoxin (DNA-binding transcriptional repressor) of toxin-antitoxin stability system